VRSPKPTASRLTRIHAACHDRDARCQENAAGEVLDDLRGTDARHLAHAIAYCERLAEAGADEIMFLIQLGTVPQWAALETIRNRGRRVLPHFRRRR
jgi:imidazole glycerol phosphate synthase subunit HisF